MSSPAGRPEAWATSSGTIIRHGPCLRRAPQAWPCQWLQRAHTGGAHARPLLHQTGSARAAHAAALTGHATTVARRHRVTTSTTTNTNSSSGISSTARSTIMRRMPPPLMLQHPQAVCGVKAGAHRWATASAAAWASTQRCACSWRRASPAAVVQALLDGEGGRWQRQSSVNESKATR
jgi:hypothetical protein